MAIIGLRHTNNFATDERPKNWREGILKLDPNGNTPLVGLTSVMKKRTTDDAEFNWWEKSLPTRRLKMTSSATALTTSNTSIALDATDGNGKTVKEGDILRVQYTGELMRVVANPTADTGITVSRGWAGTTATAVDTTAAGRNPFLLVVGSVYEEGSVAPTGVNFDPVKKYNYTQIFRNTLEMTCTASKTRLRTGDSVKEAKRECLETHSIDMERAFWLGSRYETTINGKPARSTGGFLWTLTNGAAANVVDAVSDHASGVEMQHLEEYLYNIFKYGSNEKMAFCGNRSLLTINQIVRKNSQFNIQSGIKEYGMNVSRLTTPFGELLVLKNHPLFNQDVGGTTAATAYYGMESWMAVVDMANVKYVNLDGSDTKYEPVLQSNGVDGMQSGYLTEAGLEISHASTHYLIKNLVAGKADA